MALPPKQTKLTESKLSIDKLLGEQPKITSRCLTAPGGRICNTVTGAEYRPGKGTDVIDINAPECVFERHQIEAGVLVDFVK